MRFSLAAIRQTLDHGPVLEPVNAGHFRFHFVLLREGYDSKKMTPETALQFVVGSTSFDSTGIVGRFQEDITVRFDNIAALANRMTAILTVESIDQSDVFQTTSFEGMVTPVAGSGVQGLNLIPAQADGQRFARLYAGYRDEAVKLKGLEVLKNNANFASARAATGTQPQNAVTVYDYAKILKSKSLPSPTDTTYAQALCYSYFNEITKYANHHLLGICTDGCIFTSLICIN